ncbi:hypothetical protein AB0E75_28725 [Streptomyces griseoviridis]|jgi:hypothetical protein|uniref:Uncharacterized protein n=1 Tax=Streptomyces griseoviridis TaxID=45398 RepID=A0A918LHY6_STRGD|nr:hypothetical protein [Streptomyces niveoruber]GGS50393.1 hypothetical protein GCM10010238_44890 [Streptomyces niveoruber]
MRSLVTVELRPAPPVRPGHAERPRRRPGTVVALALLGTSAGRVYGFSARARRPGAAGVSGGEEHVAADAEVCRDPGWLSCSDVLYTGRARQMPDAVRWLTSVMGAFPGCRLAAAPLAGGGWAVLDDVGRPAALLGPRVPADQPLLASCLYAWLVLGHEVRALDDLRVWRGA